jgi:putative tryptophan/tyrosine transport system substrate-binding protein
MFDSKRREFITLLGGAAVSWPRGGWAQQPERMRRIGVLILYAQTDREGQARVAAFLDTLQRLGWTDGRNVRIEYRWSAGDVGREKASAAELVRSTPDVIVVSGWTALAELKRLTTMIPIVFTQVSDPVDSGLVASLARVQISAVFRTSSQPWGANGWEYSRRPRPTCDGQPCSSVRIRSPLWRCCMRPRRWRRRLTSR